MSKCLFTGHRAHVRLLPATVLTAALTTTTLLPMPAPAADNGASLEEVIVTATRREERNQDVAVAITAFSPERLQQQNITTAQDLNASVPSLTVGAVGQGSRDSQTFTMRGQGATFQASPGVVVYFNEVPLPAPVSLSQQGGPGNYLDLENVQVLAGPQGTLFGRNTTGGAVLLVPHKPTNDFGGYGQITAGNYNNQQVEGVLNVPVIADTLLVRLAATYQDRDGYTHDVTFNKDRDNVHYYAGRLGVLFKSGPVENYLLAYGAYSKTNGTGLIAKGFNIEGLKAITLPDGTPAPFCIEGPAIPNAVASCDQYRALIAQANALGPRTTALSIDEYQSTRTWGVINTTDFALTDALKLRNIVSYQKFVSHYLYDGDGTLAQQNDVDVVAGRLAPGYINGVADYPRDDIKDITEELQLQGSLLDNRLQFTVGAFYYDQKPDGTQMGSSANYCPLAFTGFCNANLNFSGVENRSEAVYAQGSLDFGAFAKPLSGLKATLGYRYTWDQIDGFDQQYTPQNPPPFGTGGFLCGSTNATVTDPSQCYFDGRLRSQAPTWTAGLDYKINNDVLIYGKVSRGYKAGGFNPYSVRPETRTFTPEYVTSKEVGIKSDWHLGSVPLRLNAAYYHTDYKDAQRASGDVNTTTFAVGAITLQSQAVIQGYELEAAIKPIPQLEIGGNYSYTDARYKNFNWTTLAPVVDCSGQLIPPGGTANSDCLPFQYVSPHIYSIHAAYNQPLPGSLGELAFFVNYSHSGEQYTEAKYTQAAQPGAMLESYELVNASLDWKNIAGSRLDAGVFVTNAFNKLYRISNTDVYPVGVLLDWATIYGEPRMYGARLRYHFGK